MSTVTDLTNTTWEIPVGWTASAGYGKFNIIGAVKIVRYNGTITEATISGIDSGIAVGYEDEGRGWDELWSAGNTVTFSSNPQVKTAPTASFTLNITGGTDATSLDLISWLEANGTQVVEEEPEVPEEPEQESVHHLTFSSPSTFTLGVIDNTKYWDGTLEYSTNATSWSVWDGTSAISSSADGKLYLRGVGNTYITGPTDADYATRGRWVLTGSDISCSGSIETLLDYQTVANGEHPTMGNKCYASLFNGCTSLITAPELPATTLSAYCYYYMFKGCTNLKVTPTLPATTLTKSCYAYMFSDCTSLTSVPLLPATTLAEQCYAYMFAYCTSISALPALPALTLPKWCYYCMFLNCTQIKLSKTQIDEYRIPYRIPTSGTGTIAGDSPFSSMFVGTGGTFAGVPSINTTYYIFKQDTALIIKQSTLESIGDAIRNRKGTTALIPVPDLAAEIASIETGVTPEGTLNITSNGIHDVTNYASASVDVQPNLDFPSISLMENGTTRLEPRDGYDGLSGVEITVAVPIPDGYIVPTGTKELTTTGEHDVTSYAKAKIVDSDLVASNIKSGVSILGVTGSLVPGITPSGTKSITSNGTHDVTNYASVNVNVADIPAVVGTKEITENGTYDATDDSLEGYSSVTVNVPTYITVSSEDELPTDAVDGTIAVVEAGESAEYSVTISLTNPVHSSSFKNCYIYDDHTANGSPIGEITSATGSTTVKTATGKLLVRLVGSFTSLDGTCTATDGVTFVAETSGGDTGSRHFTFNVDADGAITIDMFDYND